MRLSHSISMTLLVSALASLSACSSDEGDGGGGTSGTAGTGVSGSGGSGATGGGGTGGGGTGGSGVSGTGGSGTSGTGGGSGVVDHPTDQTQAGIEAYLAAETYKQAGMGWRPEAMPGDDAAVPHLATNRYFNETIIASKAAGNKPPSMGQHTPGSMSIKEILEGTTVIGKAMTLRTDSNMWLYYCKSSQGARCGTGVADNTAFYGTSGTSSCACHGSGTNISHDAIPAP